MVVNELTKLLNYIILQDSLLLGAAPPTTNTACTQSTKLIVFVKGIRHRDMHICMHVLSSEYSNKWLVTLL